MVELTKITGLTGSEVEQAIRHHNTFVATVFHNRDKRKD